MFGGRLRREAGTMSELLPIVGVVKRPAFFGNGKHMPIYVYLIKYNDKFIEGGWSNELMANNYADRLFNGSIKPKFVK